MRRSLSLVGGVALGLALSQFPEYAQQYSQRLGGAVDELAAITARFDREASAAGLTRQDAFKRYGASGDSFIDGQGRNMEAIFARHAELSTILAEIGGAGPWQRLRDVPLYLDSEIGGRTLENYQPALPVTLEGLSYAAAGLAVGYMIVSILIGLLMLPFRRSRRTA